MKENQLIGGFFFQHSSWIGKCDLGFGIYDDGEGIKSTLGDILINTAAAKKIMKIYHETKCDINKLVEGYLPLFKPSNKTFISPFLNIEQGLSLLIRQPLEQGYLPISNNHLKMATSPCRRHSISTKM